ncbi:MAG: hypothetical protein Q9185_006123 [Variospora sp. 1 TL-2023]
MKQTLSQSWKFLTSKLHQPLPLNHRESQKLLNLLNDSFKRNFDREFPPGLADTDYSPNDHFQSLLKSPLLSVNRTRRSSTLDRKMDIKQDAAQVRDLVFAVKQPVEYFRQRVATGAANMASAKLALDNQMKKALASASVDAKDSIRASEMGAVMTNWLWSSGRCEDLKFFKDRDFVARLMPFLVVEGQYKPIWEWLHRSQRIAAPSRNAGSLLHKDVGYFIKKLVQSEALYGQGLQSAIQMFLTSLRSMAQQFPAPQQYTLSELNYPAGVYLIRLLVAQSTSSRVDESVIHSFDRSLESWVHRPLVACYRSLIQLLRPQQRASVQAAKLISAIETCETQVTRKERLILIRVGLKAVDFLLANDSLKEAAQVMKILQLRFGAELGIDNKPADGTRDDEDAALRSLNLLLAT